MIRTENFNKARWSFLFEVRHSNRLLKYNIKERYKCI